MVRDTSRNAILHQEKRDSCPHVIIVSLPVILHVGPRVVSVH